MFHRIFSFVTFYDNIKKKVDFFGNFFNFFSLN